MTLPKPCARHPGPVRCRVPGFGLQGQKGRVLEGHEHPELAALERTLHELGSHADADSEEILEALRRLEEALRKILAS